MSRISKKQILIPAGVTVSLNDNKVTVAGPKGQLVLTIRPEIGVAINDGIISCSEKIVTKQSPAYWGLTGALLTSAIVGVTKGYEKKLELVGVGYRVKEAANGITLSLGFSHPVEITAPEGIKFTVPDQQNVTIEGVNKQLVGLTAAQIRKLKKPEPYKGKGIKYAGEVIRRKAGKSGKA